MGLTTSLFTSLSGLNTNSQGINVTGNNIANVNTTAYKTSRALFETQIAETLSQGTSPSANLGGTNPTQVGLGTRLAAVNRNMNDGSIQTTGVNTDVAIEGDGFFVLEFGAGQRYTRAGAFNLDSNFNLVDPNGGQLQGFGIDDQFNVIEGVLQDINLPIGALTVAKETNNVQFKGNLNASGEVASIASIITSSPLTDATAGTPATTNSLLTDLRDINGDTFLAADDVITLTGVTKGQVAIADHTFAVTGADPGSVDAFGTTVGEFMDFLNDLMGISQDADPAAGVTINGSGEITVRGNTGVVNDLVFSGGNFSINLGTVQQTNPFTFTKLDGTVASGESVRTTFDAVDSLGSPLTLDLSMVLEEKSNAGTVWRYYVHSQDDTDVDTLLGTGLLQFDTRGQLTSDPDQSVFIDRQDTGAITPQRITLQFSSGDGAISALTDVRSELFKLNQDGVTTGTLEDFSIAEDGTILGTFSNSIQRTLGRVALATFTNPLGLVEQGSNLFTTSANSGAASIGSPLSGGAGRTINGALELSNVDLSQEFINLVIYSTGFSASSRVLTTSNQLIQDLLNTVR